MSRQTSLILLRQQRGKNFVFFAEPQLTPPVDHSLDQLESPSNMSLTLTILDFRSLQKRHLLNQMNGKERNELREYKPRKKKSENHNIYKKRKKKSRRLQVVFQNDQIRNRSHSLPSEDARFCSMELRLERVGWKMILDSLYLHKCLRKLPRRHFKITTTIQESPLLRPSPISQHWRQNSATPPQALEQRLQMIWSMAILELSNSDH